MAAESKLRIAQIAPLWAQIPPLTYGGIELAVNLLVEELIARGHEVTLFASGDCRTSAQLHAVCEEHLLALMQGAKAYAAEYYMNAAVADALRRASEFDVLHFHSGAQWVAFGAASPTPAIFTLHTSLMVDDHWILSRHPEVTSVGISRSQVNALSQGGVEVPVIHNGCDFEAYTPQFEPGTYLAFLGRMSEKKNPLGAIQIARAAGMPLVLAGMPQDSEEEDYYKQFIVPHIDGCAVRHIGPVNHSQKNELLRNAAALLFPIQWEEPFGLVMIEAMACGTPVLAARLGSVGEVVDDGITGYSGDTIEELIAALPATLGLNRREVRRHASERFHFQRMVDHYERLYQSLARKSLNVP